MPTFTNGVFLDAKKSSESSLTPLWSCWKPALESGVECRPSHLPGIREILRSLRYTTFFFFSHSELQVLVSCINFKSDFPKLIPRFFPSGSAFALIAFDFRGEKKSAVQIRRCHQAATTNLSGE